MGRGFKYHFIRFGRLGSVTSVPVHSMMPGPATRQRGNVEVARPLDCPHIEPTVFLGFSLSGISLEGVTCAFSLRYAWTSIGPWYSQSHGMNEALARAVRFQPGALRHDVVSPSTTCRRCRQAHEASRAEWSSVRVPTPTLQNRRLRSCLRSRETRIRALVQGRTASGCGVPESGGGPRPGRSRR